MTAGMLDPVLTPAWVLVSKARLEQRRVAQQQIPHEVDRELDTCGFARPGRIPSDPPELMAGGDVEAAGYGAGSGADRSPGDVVPARQPRRRSVERCAGCAAACTGDAGECRRVAGGPRLVAVATWLEQRRDPPPCYGIGWGCSPNPLDEALLAGIFIGAPTAVVTGVAVAIGWSLRRVAPRAALVVMWTPAAVLAAGAGVLLVASSV